jgi:lysophospholipase L1-like esterase
MDEAIRLAASAAGVPFFTVTARFRAEAPNPPLYFELDGHFTPQGHRLFGDSIAPAVRDALERARQAAPPPGERKR